MRRADRRVVALLMLAWTRRVSLVVDRWWSSIRSTAGHSRGHMGWIVLWTCTATVGTVLSPVLLRYPVALMAMAPRALFVAVAATQLDLASFVVLGTVRLGVTDPSYYLVGRRLGAAASDRTDARRRSGLFRRLVTLMCRSRPLAAGVLFLRPNARYLAVAGANGIPGVVAGGAAIAGTISYLVLIHSGVGFVF